MRSFRQDAVLDHVVCVVIDPSALVADALEVLLAAGPVSRIPVHVVQLRPVELVMKGQPPARFLERRNRHVGAHRTID